MELIKILQEYNVSDQLDNDNDFEYNFGDSPQISVSNNEITDGLNDILKNMINEDNDSTVEQLSVKQNPLYMRRS